MLPGNVISDPNPAERKTPVGDGRVARVILDPAQYHQDSEFAESKRSLVRAEFEFAGP